VWLSVITEAAARVHLLVIDISFITLTPAICCITQDEHPLFCQLPKLISDGDRIGQQTVRELESDLQNTELHFVRF
jgi:hypothetical protein